LDWYKYPQKKTFSEFFSLGLCIGTKGEKLALFGFGTGTKSEFRIFVVWKFNFSLLVPALNPKCSTFSPLVPIQRPQVKKSENAFFEGICTSPNSLFLNPKKFFETF
jgi:hypothetical protein